MNLKVSSAEIVNSVLNINLTDLSFRHISKEQY